MQYSSYTTEIEEFTIHEAFGKLEGEFNFLRPQFFFQPYADLELNEEEVASPKNKAHIGLRLITNFYDQDTPCIEFITETRCILDYSEPSNENAVFQEVSERAIEDHGRLFSGELHKVGFVHSSFSSVKEQEKKKIFQNLIDHFREQF